MSVRIGEGHEGGFLPLPEVMGPCTVHLMLKGATYEDGRTLCTRTLERIRHGLEKYGRIESAQGEKFTLPIAEVAGLYYLIVSVDGRAVWESGPTYIEKGKRLDVLLKRTTPPG